MNYLALLRGINVGGKNIIKMSALKTIFEDLGFTDVTTYIQSGNVLFSAPVAPIETLCKNIEAALFKAFNYDAVVVLIKQSDLINVVRSAPKGFGSDPKTYRYNVLFLKKPLVAKQAIQDVRCKEGVDEVFAGTGVLYFSNLIAKATQSRLNTITALPIYKRLTIRNWNTTQKLRALIEA